jgi:hypothetical protein
MIKLKKQFFLCKIFLFIGLGMMLLRTNNQVVAMEKLNNELIKDEQINQNQDKIQKLDESLKYPKEYETTKNDDLLKTKKYFIKLFIQTINVKLIFIKINICL